MLGLKREQTEKIFFTLSAWMYFIFEALTEAMTWTTRKGDPHIKYHLCRVGENAGIVIALLILIFALGKDKIKSWLSISFFAITSGLPIYEFVMSKYMYGDWFYHRTSQWIIFKHPSPWVWLGILIVSIGVLVYLICKKK